MLESCGRAKEGRNVVAKVMMSCLCSRISVKKVSVSVLLPHHPLLGLRGSGFSLSTQFIFLCEYTYAFTLELIGFVHGGLPLIVCPWPVLTCCCVMQCPSSPDQRLV